ncbi:MAG: YdbC family protein [Ignavibacteriales bacterium]
MSEISYDIIKKVGVIGESTKGWKKEFNLISWNGREAKYDIRDWSEGNEKMGKGVTLSKDELGELKKILNSMDI